MHFHINVGTLTSLTHASLFLETVAIVLNGNITVHEFPICLGISGLSFLASNLLKWSQRNLQHSRSMPVVQKKIKLIDLNDM
jgi:hypothetical protein